MNGSSNRSRRWSSCCPSAWFGSDSNAALFGRPAIDLQMAYERNWSNIAAFNFGVWHVGAALKLGWRF